MTDAVSPTNNGVWRPSPFLRVVAVVAVVIAVVLSIWTVRVAAIEDASVLGMGAFALLVFLLPAAALGLFAFRCRLDAGPEDVRVVRMFSERRIPWTDIRSVEPDRSGVSLELADGSTFVTGALQDPDPRGLIGRPTNADALAEAISVRIA